MIRRKYILSLCVVLFGVCVFILYQHLFSGMSEVEISMHPYVGYVFNPLYQKGVNTLGFYGPVPQKQDDTKFKVGIFGGSVAHMYSSMEYKELQSSIATQLGVAPKQVALYSFALPGYKQPQQLMALTYLYSLGYRFDLILNIDGFNEIALSYVESYGRGVSSYFPRNWYLYSRGVQQFEAANLIRIYHILRTLQYKAAQYSWEKSYTAQKLWAWAYYQVLGALDSRLKKIPSPYQTQGPETYAGATDADVKKQIIDTWKQSTIQMNHIAKANGAQYIEFLQPNQYVPNTKPYSAEELQKFVNKNHPYAEITKNMYPELIRAAHSSSSDDLTIVDLSQVFLHKNETLYADDCCHYNKRGYEILTSAIMDAITPLLQNKQENSELR